MTTPIFARSDRHCGKCGGTDHDAKRCQGAGNPPKPRWVQPPKKRKPCAECGEFGHDRRRHRVPTGKRPRMGRAQRNPFDGAEINRSNRFECARCQAPGHSTKTHDEWAAREQVVVGPRTIAKGDRFVVVEDLAEEERPRVRWLTDEIWTAASRAAGEDEGFERWKMRRVPDGKTQIGHPQLTPFFPASAPKRRGT
jgi:hypothetical protein